MMINRTHTARIERRSLFAVIALLCCLSAASYAAGGRGAAAPRFYLKDGDKVVFYGDSITDQRLYTTYIESYCVSRFPKEHFTFVHSGWGGDRVTGGGGGPIDLRLKRDVLVYRPTVVTICLGMNDASYRPFDQGIFDTYVKGYRHILDTLKKELPGVRITLLTAPAFDDVTRAPSFEGGYNTVLVRYGEAVAQLAKEYNLTLADTNAPLVAALNKAKAQDEQLAAKLIPDRVHPGPGGHAVMAAAVLKAWNAPATVADVVIDAAHKRVAAQKNTRISGLKADASGLSFTQTDASLPWPIDRSKTGNPDMIQALAVTDYDSTLNSYRLKVTGLSAGRYKLVVDGVEIDQIDADALAAGINLADYETLPANVQAHNVLNLTRKHNDLHFRRWREIQVPGSHNEVDPPAAIKPQMDALDQQDAEAVAQQQQAARPQPHKVEIVRA